MEKERSMVSPHIHTEIESMITCLENKKKLDHV